MSPPKRIRYGPLRRKGDADAWRKGGSATLGVHCWPDTLAALHFFALEHNLRPSGAAHVLLRKALKLPPIKIQPTTPN